MRNIQATGNLFGQTLTINQVSKAKAKKLFAAGKEIYLQSSNMYPFNMWQSVCPIKLDKEQLQSDIELNNFSIKLYSEQVENFTNKPEEWSKPLIAEYAAKVAAHKAKVIDANSQFEYMVINYSWYNCDNERGKYVTFYAKHEDI